MNIEKNIAARGQIQRRDFIKLAGMGAIGVSLFPRLGKSATDTFQGLEKHGDHHGKDHPLRGASGPAANLSLIFGRPTDRSIALSVLSTSEIAARVEYGTKPGTYMTITAIQTVKAGMPFEFELGALLPNTRYYYRLLTQAAGAHDFRPEPEGFFQTQRTPGSTFSFALQGDSHPEREGKMYDPNLYTLTMRNVMKEPPDFYITMGDDFSTERLVEQQTLNPSAVEQIYAHQRSFLGLIGRSASLFLVNGNHEQAARCNLDGTPNNVAVLAGRTRTRFFPLPAPDTFYDGDAEQVQYVGLLRDYYSWTWGDALFVTIDPYWHSAVAVDNKAGGRNKGGKHEKGGNKEGGKRDQWEATMGDVQYRWLSKTLTESKARWKFVFSHHVLGTGRGGIEEAGSFEWGGKNRDGEYEFKQKRPGWALPIHQLMVKTGVTIFFQGHDHLYARQELNGIIYQSCPNPADNTYQAFNNDAYQSGDILPNCGHLRMTVSPVAVRVDYIRSFLHADEGNGKTNGMLAHSYSIPAKRIGATK